MPNEKRNRGTSPRVELPDELILAAIERAELHSRSGPGVVFSTIKDHLGLPRGSGSGRLLRPRVRDMEARKLVRQYREHSCQIWTLTRKGRSRLDAARQAQQLGELPESPQHRFWREARSIANERLNEFREELSDGIGEAKSLLAASERSSAEWFALAERLEAACSQLSSANYCLHEWAEPTDAARDTAWRNIYWGRAKIAS
jgi:hypothetical protein